MRFLEWTQQRSERARLSHQGAATDLNGNLRHPSLNPTSMALLNFIERCLKSEEDSDSKEMVIVLLPRAHKLGLIHERFRCDCPLPSTR